MKWQARIEVPQLVMIAALWAWVPFAWSRMPDKIPVHWNAAGQVDGWGGRFEGLLLVPILALALYLILFFIPMLDPGRANYEQFAGAYGTIRITLQGVMLGVFALTQAWALGHPIPFERAMPVLLGGMFVILGGVIGKVRPNWFVGVRTPWTLSSKLSWVKTHRLAGRLFVATGLLSIAAGLASGGSWTIGVLVGGGVGSGLVSAIYSWFVWRNDHEKIPPAGTLPAD